MKSDKVIEVMEHPILDLLYKVNPEMTKFDFMQLSCIYRDLLGASPWILEGGDSRGMNPTMMFIARPEFFRAEKDKDGRTIKYVYEIGDYKREFSPENVIFLKNYNPKNPEKGMGILEAVRITAENDDYIAQTNNNLLTNGAVPGGYIETEDELDAKEVKRLEKKARAKFAGFQNAYKVQVLQGGAKFKANIIPPREMEFIEGRKLNRDEIAAIFGVPKSLLTFDDVNLASAKTGEYQFAKYTIEPLARQIFEQLNEFFVTKFDGGEDLWLDFEPLAKEDDEVVIREKEASCNKWRTINEIREEEGKDALDGGEYIYLPLSSMPMVGGNTKDALKSGNVLKIGSSRKLEGRVSLKKEIYIKKRILNRNLRMKKIARSAYEAVSKKLDERLNGKKVLSFRIVEKKADAKQEKKN